MILTIDQIREYGILKSFETICTMYGENVFIIEDNDVYDDRIDDKIDDDYFTHEDNNENIKVSSDLDVDVRNDEDNSFNNNNNNNNGDDDNDNDNDNSVQSIESSPSIAYNGVLYAELQYNAKTIAKQLHHRFGIKAYDRVYLICKGNITAEELL